MTALIPLRGIPGRKVSPRWHFRGGFRLPVQLIGATFPTGTIEEKSSVQAFGLDRAAWRRGIHEGMCRGAVGPAPAGEKNAGKRTRKT